MFRLPLSRTLSSCRRPLYIRPKASSQLSRYPVRYKVTLTETIHIRFQESSQARRRVFQAFVYIAAFYVFQRVVLGPLDDIDLPEENVKGAKKTQKTKPTPEEVLDGTDGYEGDDDPLFLPLGWMTELPRQWYKGSDPEWQEFRKLAKDPHRNRAIREQLISSLRSHYENHPQSKQMVGRIDHKAGRYWLDLHFPDGPPTEYSRAGLEITDDAIAWTNRPVSERNHQRLNRALYPLATVQSIYATSAVLMKLTWFDLQAYLGMNPKRDIEVVQVKRLQQAIAAHQQMHHSHSNGNGNGNGSDMLSSTSTSASLQSHSISKTSAADGSKSVANMLPNPSGILNAGLSPSLMANVTLCRLLFMHNLTNNKSWKVKPDPPRGSVVVSGLIEIVGQKGRLIVDVAATYDVKTEKFVEVMSAPRQFRPYRQIPKGGTN